MRKRCEICNLAFHLLESGICKQCYEMLQEVQHKMARAYHTYRDIEVIDNYHTLVKLCKKYKIPTVKPFKRRKKNE